MSEQDKFQMGELSAEVRNLIVQTTNIGSELAFLRIAIEELKIWKGQVMTVSWISSFVASGIFFLIGKFLNRLWP